jgi:hypothetical protein
MAPHTRAKRELKRRLQRFAAWTREIGAKSFNGLYFLDRKYRAPSHLLGLPVEVLF